MLRFAHVVTPYEVTAEESMVFRRELFGNHHSEISHHVSSFQLMTQPLQRSRNFVSLAILALLGLTGCGKKLPDCSQNDLGKTVNASASSASPPSLSVPRKPVAAKDVLIGIDGSGSMFGYTPQQPATPAFLRDVLPFSPLPPAFRHSGSVDIQANPLHCGC